MSLYAELQGGRNNSTSHKIKYTRQKIVYPSTGYVIDTLEASLWCIFNTSSFKDAVLKAVNLGDDTDTVGAITGALAGIIYGSDSIPNEWLDVLARKDDIIELANRLDSVKG